MTVKPLQPSQPVTQKGDLPSNEMLIIIQQMVREIADLQARVQVLEGP